MPALAARRPEGTAGSPGPPGSRAPDARRGERGEGDDGADDGDGRAGGAGPAHRAGLAHRDGRELDEGDRVDRHDGEDREARDRGHDFSGGADGARDVARAAAGDRDAFRRLHRRFAPLVHAVLLARAGAQDAEDLVQETFVTAWKELGALRDPARFGPWIAAIARRSAARAARRRRPRAASLERGTEAEGAELADPRPPRGAPERGEAERAALACLLELPTTYRELLALRFVEGLTGPEIARALGRAERTVRVQLARGTALLRERLARRGWTP